MRKLALVAALLCAGAAHAQVYKCVEGSVTTYASAPCGSAPKAVDLNVRQPTAAEAREARRRALIDKRDALSVDAERERDYQEKLRDRSRRAQAEASFNAKCQGYERRAAAAAAEREMYRTQPFRDDAERRRREAADAHFSECYGER